VCFKENCRNELIQFLEENFQRIRFASEWSANPAIIAMINQKQTEHEIRIQNNEYQIDTNKRTTERKQDDSTKTLTNRINELEKQDRQQQKMIEILKNDLQNNTAFNKVLLNETFETSTNQESTSKIVEDTPITTWAIIVIIIWNTALTITGACYLCSFSKQPSQSPDQNATSANASDLYMEIKPNAQSGDGLYSEIENI
jgi:hypothetical protein